MIANCLFIIIISHDSGRLGCPQPNIPIIIFLLNKKCFKFMAFKLKYTIFHVNDTFAIVHNLNFCIDLLAFFKFSVLQYLDTIISTDIIIFSNYCFVIVVKFFDIYMFGFFDPIIFSTKSYKQMLPLVLTVTSFSSKISKSFSLLTPISKNILTICF